MNNPEREKGKALANSKRKGVAYGHGFDRHVQPGTGRHREMHMKARVPAEPALDTRIFACPVVV
jgi:hypothetical protein